jgi:hypothetical protein
MKEGKMFYLMIYLFKSFKEQNTYRDRDVVRTERPHFLETGKRRALHEGQNRLFGHAKRAFLMVKNACDMNNTILLSLCG